ncbi:hypothetical protein T484DRAFT_2019114 [Baffinella frigidus]|nr:hypothetical protein T484DRAFT_2019114 [Cryptophyta sp. CCMP2293]
MEAMHEAKENVLPRENSDPNTPISVSSWMGKDFAAASKPSTHSGLHHSSMASPQISRGSLISEPKDEIEGICSGMVDSMFRTALSASQMPAASPLPLSRTSIGGFSFRTAENKPAAAAPVARHTKAPAHHTQDAVMDDVATMADSAPAVPVSTSAVTGSIPLVRDHLLFLASWRSPADSIATASALALVVTLSLVWSAVSLAASAILLALAVQIAGEPLRETLAGPGSGMEAVLNLDLFSLKAWKNGTMLVLGAVVEATQGTFSALEEVRTGNDMMHTAKVMVSLCFTAATAPLLLTSPLMTSAVTTTLFFSAVPATQRVRPHFHKITDAVLDAPQAARVVAYSVGATAALAILLSMLSAAVTPLRTMGVAVAALTLLAKGAKAHSLTPARFLLKLCVEGGQAGVQKAAGMVRSLRAPAHTKAE